MSMTSYAQNFEDVMLLRALSHVEKGFYIDIGAQDPLVDSVSLAFHERGWRGVHVEPVNYYAELLRQQRPGDVVIQAAIGTTSSILTFFEIPDSGISTANPSIAAKHRQRGFEIRETTVPCIPLAAVFDSIHEPAIHWLKIDVEGFEREVLQSWFPSNSRPWIVVVESTLPMTTTDVHQEWEGLLSELDYRFVYFDGLNRYYVSADHIRLQQAFSIPPNIFDDFSLNGTASSPLHRAITERYDRLISELNQRHTNAASELLQKQVTLKAQQEASAAREADAAAALEQSRRESYQQALTHSRQIQEIREGTFRELASLGARHLEERRTLQSVHAEQIRFYQQESQQLREYAISLDARHLEREREFDERLDRAKDLAFKTQANLLSREQESAKEVASLIDRHAQELAGLEEAAQAAIRIARAREADLLRTVSTEHKARALAETLLVQSRQQVDTIQSSWLWRFFYPMKSRSKHALSTNVHLQQSKTFAPDVGEIGQAQAVSSFRNLAAELRMNKYSRADSAVGTIDELLMFYDEDFVRCAYLTVLLRPVDDVGLSGYLQLLRDGTDREQIIVALATSTEAVKLGLDHLPGLHEFVRATAKNRPSIFARLASRMLLRILRPMRNQVDGLAYRLDKIDDSTRLAFEQLNQSIVSLEEELRIKASDESQEAKELKALTPYARSIYFKLRDANRENSRISMT